MGTMKRKGDASEAEGNKLKKSKRKAKESNNEDLTTANIVKSKKAENGDERGSVSEPDEAELTPLQRCQRLLADYEGSLSAKDVSTLAAIYELDAEQKGRLLCRLRPTLFHWAAKEVYCDNEGGQGWREVKVSEALDLVDANAMSKSCLHLDINLCLDIPTSKESDPKCGQEELYDPRFFLPWFCSLCSPQSFVDRHWKLLDRGALSLGIAALSARDKHMRLMGYTLVARVYRQLEKAKLHSEKQLWLHLIDALRRGVAESVSKSRANDEEHEEQRKDSNGFVANGAENNNAIRVLRLPSLLTVFLVRVVNILRAPLDPLHKRISSFILAKPVLNLFNVPDFLRLLHSTEPRRHEERSLLLSVLIDGTKDALDVNVLKQDYVLKMLLSLYDAPDLIDAQYRRQVRQLLLRVASVAKGAFTLIKAQGILTWIANAWTLAPTIEKKAGPVKARSELLLVLSAAWKSIFYSLSASGKSMPAPMAMETHLLFHQLTLTPSDLTEDMWRCVANTMSLIQQAFSANAEDESGSDFEVFLEESVSTLKKRVKITEFNKIVKKELKRKMGEKVVSSVQ